LRRELLVRRGLARDAIEKHWPKTTRVANGSGGFYLWATAAREVRARALLDTAERLGATFLFGEAFYAASGGERNFRLAITPMTHDDMAEGIRRIGEAFAAVSSR
jgi:DNA-binding transcriptional MocR family regulator